MTDSPLRVTFISAARRWTGGERCMVSVANGLARRGHDVNFAYDPRGPVGDRLASEVRSFAIRIRNDIDLAAMLRLRSRIREQNAEVVCVNAFRELKVGGLAARLAGSARVVSGRGANDVLSEGTRQRLLYRYLLDMVVRDSQAGCRRIRRENPWFRRPILQARSGVDANELAAVELLPRMEIGAEDGELLIAVLDRPGRWMGSPDLMEAAIWARSRAREGTPPVRLVVFGELDAQMRAELLRRAETRDDVRVSLLGVRRPAETLRILASCDIMARPTRVEALSYAVLEAMALGLPVIASDIGGLAEMVLDRVTGRLVPPDDVEALGQAIHDLLHDPGLRKRMGAAGRVHVAREFSEDRMLDDYETAFRLAVAGPRLAAGSVSVGWAW